MIITNRSVEESCDKHLTEYLEMHTARYSKKYESHIREFSSKELVRETMLIQDLSRQLGEDSLFAVFKYR